MSIEMELPDNKTCADCAHVEKCRKIFGVRPENTECDFYPVRFYPAHSQPEEIND